jgi:hypothetical protein
LRDPMLIGDEHHFLLQVRKSTDLVSTEGVRLNLPFDTLVQGRTYTWNGGTTVVAWAEQGIQLKSVVGPDSTLFAGEILTLKPQHVGSHDLLFQFETPTGPMQQAMAFPVVEDQPPTRGHRP